MTGEVKALVGIGIVVIVIFIGGIFSLTKDSTPEVSFVNPIILTNESSNAIVGENSRFTLVEFSDYQCSFCAQAHPFIEVLLGQYGDQLTFVYRHFPLAQHQYAQLAAEVAEAAGAQGKFWEMHNLIFTNQADWEAADDSVSIFRGYAEELELDLEQFDQSIETHEFLGKIQQDLADANLAGVNSTPAFFVDGERFSGSLGSLEALINAKLSTR